MPPVGRRRERRNGVSVALTLSRYSVSVATPMFSSLLSSEYRVADIAAVSRWGSFVEWRASEAVKLFAPRCSQLCNASSRISAVEAYFNFADPSHPFHAQPHAWLRLTEVQAVKGLADMLNQHGQEALSAFLRALSPTTPWPFNLKNLSAIVEVPVGNARIDLLVVGYSGEQRWGAVVEAKLEHDPSGNPLSRYADYGRRKFQIRSPDGSDKVIAGALILLAKKRSPKINLRLDRNMGWTFVHWRALLTRLDREMSGLDVTEDFLRFRRTLWDRVG